MADSKTIKWVDEYKDDSSSTAKTDSKVVPEEPAANDADGWQQCIVVGLLRVSDGPVKQIPSLASRFVFQGSAWRFVFCLFVRHTLTVEILVKYQSVSVTIGTSKRCLRETDHSLDWKW